MYKSFILFLFLSLSLTTFANEGYKLKVKIDNFNGEEVYLGYHYGEKQYIQDTVALNAQGYFVFEGEEKLPGGVYLVIMPPDNQFFQLMISEDEQNFTVHINAEDPVKDAHFINAPDNQLFYSYLNFLDEKRPVAEKLRADITAAQEAGQSVEKEERALEQLNNEVTEYQKKLILKHPKTLTAAIIKASMELEAPEFTGTEQEVQLNRWHWYRKHWFDNSSITDPRMLRSPVLFGKVDHYVNKLSVQHPDSISLAIDEVLTMMRPAEETFKYYLIHFLNDYAKSKIVGMDAVYVHLVNEYYKKGLAPWTDEEQLDKIIKNANTLDPILIGKIAPDIMLQKESGEKLSLHQLKSDFTVLFFWDPDCGHCKKSMPAMVEFYEKYKSKGVEVFAVCTKIQDDIPKCWEFIKEHDMINWINMVDPFLRSRYKQIYDIRTTPQIYILDENKKILSKRIGSEQLPEVMDELIRMKDNSKSLGSKGG